MLIVLAFLYLAVLFPLFIGLMRNGGSLDGEEILAISIFWPLAVLVLAVRGTIKLIRRGLN